MKHRLIIVIFLLLQFGITAVAQTSKVIYTCPMHPEIQQAGPGKCPKCGMSLVKKTVKANAPKAKPAPKTQPKTTVPHKHQESGREVVPDDEGTHAVAETPLEKAPKAASSEASMIKAPPPHRVRYDLYVKDTVVNYTGRQVRHAIAINGSIPAPTLYFNEGDTAEIWVHNEMHHETSVHWHGLILPNTEDGVSYLTTAPIKPHSSHRFFFPIVQNGTYWYHSHTMTQEQDGMYGAFIINKREEPAIRQLPVVLSDWSDMKSGEINRSLHTQTEWFGIRKNSVQSYSEAISNGHFKTKLENEWKRMLAMDVSDVFYNRFLINGTPDNEQPQFKAGEKVRLRVVNGSASTYFWLTWAGAKMTVVASDGEDVEPVEVDRLLIAVSETFDILVTIPDDGHSFEFLATPEDRTKSASLWLGTGTKVIAPHLPKLKYFEGMKMMNDMMRMNGDMKPMEGMQMTNQIMDMNTVMYPEITGGKGEEYGNTVGKVISHDHVEPEGQTANDGWEDMNSGPLGIKTLNYTMLRAPKKTTLPPGPMRTLYFELTGNMNRYVWTLDNKTISETDFIRIKSGENIRIVLFNNTMMRHPMHLHGHYFRVLNGHGDYAPLKNVLDIMPMETDTIEFAGNASGDWFFHCHILYHMMSGMGRIFSYENSPPNPQLPDLRKAHRKLFADDRKFYFSADIGLESNGSDGELQYSNTRWLAETEWRLGLKPENGYESETIVGRYLGKMQWWMPFIGFDYHYNDRVKNPGEPGYEPEYNLFGQESNQANRSTIMAGVRYTLPMLVVAEARVDGTGRFRMQLSREDIPLSRRFRLNLMANTDKEYMAGLRYIAGKYLSLSTHYDSDMGWGVGVAVTY